MNGNWQTGSFVLGDGRIPYYARPRQRDQLQGYYYEVQVIAGSGKMQLGVSTFSVLNFFQNEVPGDERSTHYVLTISKTRGTFRVARSADDPFRQNATRCLHFQRPELLSE